MGFKPCFAVIFGILTKKLKNRGNSAAGGHFQGGKAVLGCSRLCLLAGGCQAWLTSWRTQERQRAGHGSRSERTDTRGSGKTGGSSRAGRRYIPHIHHDHSEKRKVVGFDCPLRVGRLKGKRQFQAQNGSGSGAHAAPKRRGATGQWQPLKN